MKDMGYEDVAVLDGGLKGWTDAGLPTNEHEYSGISAMTSRRSRSSPCSPPCWAVASVLARHDVGARSRPRDLRLCLWSSTVVW